jgi:quercetin dioxygenase-like cupin family protein
MTLPTPFGDAIEPGRVGPPEHFTGRARIYSISEGLGTEELRIRAVYFDAGTRARPHLHSCDQLLYFVEGGIVALDGGPDQRVESGRYVLLPAAIVHMHGAADDAPAVHISMMREIDSDFDAPIADAWKRYRADG